MKESLDKINMAILSITIKNPFVGSILMRMDFIENDITEKVYIGEKTVIYYNRKYINRFDRNSLKYLLYFIFFLNLNRISNKINNYSDESGTVDLNMLHIAMESCLNSYLTSVNIGNLNVESIKPYYSYKGKVYDFNYEDYYKLISSGIFVIDEKYDLLVDIIRNPEIESMNLIQDVVDKDFSSLVQVYIEDLGLSADELAKSLESFGCGTFFKPDELIRFCKTSSKSYVNWREVIKGDVMGHQKNLYKLNPNQNMNFGNRIIPLMPRRFPSEIVDLAVAVDVSYSISEDVIRRFLNEIFKIVSVFNNYSIKFWTFSCEVNRESYAEFDSQDNLIDDNYVFEVNIGGSTVFEKNWEFMAEEKIKPNILIVFTDGQPNYGWGDPKYCDTIFVVFDPNGFFKAEDAPSFGKTLVIESI